MINNFQFDISSLLFVIPEIFLLSATIAILILNLFLTKNKQLVYYLTQLVLLVTGLLCFNLIGETKAIIFGGSFILDDIALIFKIFIIASTMVAMTYSRHYLITHSLFVGEYFVLILLSLLGMMVMVSGYSLLTMYLGLEILSLSLYTLIAIARDRTIAIEAALKYFILGSISSGLLLYGMSMIYGVTGSINIIEIAEFVANTGIKSNLLVINFSLVFLVIAIAFKLGAVPFHMWVPDVYQGSPTSVTMFISTVPKMAVIAILIRLLTDGLEYMHIYWSDLLIVLALLSIAIGAVVALKQTNIKRMLAYSTISHIGFVILGFVTGVISGYAASVFYILVYILTSLAAFGIIILFNKKGFEADKIIDYKGFSKHSPWFALMMLIVMLSMAGIPPFIGFYSKFFILQQVVAEGYVFVAIFAVVFAVISSYYYLQIIKFMYFDQSEKTAIFSAPMDIKIVVSINAVLILIVGLFPDFWIELSRSLF
jgi:NADH-quinone oxidoreductase subunit N